MRRDLPVAVAAPAPDPSWRRLARAHAVVACALVALAFRDARADETNFRPYVIGSRAAGMGGAFTALADDGSGPFYNPGGIAFAARSHLSLSGSVYGIASGSFADALGDGHDFHYSSLQTFPTATAGVFKLGPDTPDSAQVLAITVYVPDAVLIDDRDTIGSRENAFLFSSQSQTVWAGLTYARRWGRLGVGVSGFFLFGTQIDQLDLSAVVLAPGDVVARQFGTVTSRIDQSTYGFVGAVGARWDATDNLRLGVSVYSPEVGWGTRREFLRLTVGDVNDPTSTGAVVINADGLHATPSLPWRAQAGIAWTSGRFTVAADVTVLAAREIHDDADKASQGLDRRIVRNAVVNGAAGVEYVVADRFPVRAGFFTDFSAAREPVAVNTLAAQDPNPSNTSHINRYGGTASVGVRSEHTATDLGVIVSGGSGQDLVFDNLSVTQLKPTRATQTFLYVFLGTSYQF